MIAIAERNEFSANTPCAQDRFVEMLPAIRRQARIAFRSMSRMALTNAQRRGELALSIAVASMAA